MNIPKYFFFALTIITIFTSCEEVIQIDLKSSDPAFVVEAIINKDSVCHVRLTRTINYFSSEEPGIIEDAVIIINDGSTTEELTYTGTGNYSGTNLKGIEGRTYEIEITYNGSIYYGMSYLPVESKIISVLTYKDESPGILNLNGEKVYTIEVEFSDNPEIIDFYMIRFLKDGKMIEKSYYMVSDQNNLEGVRINPENNSISFSESVFFEGGDVEIQVYSIDESVFNYFSQLNDVLFWKRRVMPPNPYNPGSNLNNKVLGYFAAWAYDSQIIELE